MERQGIKAEDKEEEENRGMEKVAGERIMGAGGERKATKEGKVRTKQRKRRKRKQETRHLLRWE